MTLQRENEQQEEVVRILKAAKAELENVNWIATHDLQEPLRKIRMLSSMMLHEEMNYSPTDFVRFAEKVNRSAESMQQLIHGILAYTRTSGEVVFEPVDLAELMSATLQDLDENIMEKKATISVDILPEVSGVPVLLKQLFVNLLSNSLKFADGARVPHITVSVADEVPGLPVQSDEFHLISWADNGIGFDPAYNQKVLDLFARLHAKDKYPGSGMGLALCKKIMLRHSGFFWAFGEPGVGATFVMAFPK